jgi:hypothetical protein
MDSNDSDEIQKYLESMEHSLVLLDKSVIKNNLFKQKKAVREFGKVSSTQ